ncbi:hypothetical protein PT974_04081 [Cladobotryum mycophilum]|uniref:N-acetyltransferase domain-containing protein n=1 Tax=Cladobotryum mycophilum TaxID=491253 RepID=A0ABR0SU33_9HYPO
MENLEAYTDRLLLRRLVSNELGGRDLEAFHQVWSSEQATQWLSRGPCKDELESQAWMAGILPSSSPGITKISYAVFHRTPKTSPSSPEMGNQGSGWEAVGIITLLPIQSPVPVADEAPNPERRILELGYLFLPTAWGRGYATESLRELLRLCRHDDDGVAPGEVVETDVRANVERENVKSVRVVEKLGFHEVGEFEVDNKRESSEGKKKITVVQYRRLV